MHVIHTDGKPWGNPLLSTGPDTLCHPINPGLTELKVMVEHADQIIDCGLCIGPLRKAAEEFTVPLLIPVEYRRHPPARPPVALGLGITKICIDPTGRQQVNVVMEMLGGVDPSTGVKQLLNKQIRAITGK
jgi:hypothetical protein